MKKALKFQATASSRLQNEINISIIFNYLRQNAPISRATISKNLGISAPAVSRVIDRLIKDGYVVEVEKAITKSGKRPTLLAINKSKDYIVVIDLGKSNFKMAICNLDGQIIEKYKKFKITDDKNIIKKIIEEIKYLLQEIGIKKNIKKNKIKAICLGIPADVDMSSGVITSASLYKSWKTINFKKALNQEFKIPVYIENDVNLSALGEKYLGDGKKYSDLVFIEISNGIGAGVVIDNHLHRGFKGSVGEIGFTIINESNLDNSSINEGNLEKFASVGSIKKRILREIELGRNTSLSELFKDNYEKIEPAIICEYAYKNDALSKEIIGNISILLSITILNTILLLNPQIVILGGDICSLPHVEELFLIPIINKIESALPFDKPEIKLSQLGEDAGLIGGTFMAIESLLVEEFPYKIE